MRFSVLIKIILIIALFFAFILGVNFIKHIFSQDYDLNNELTYIKESYSDEVLFVLKIKPIIMLNSAILFSLSLLSFRIFLTIIIPVSSIGLNLFLTRSPPSFI